MSRSLLHQLKLGPFLHWCNANGFETTEGDGHYMVARVKPKQSKHGYGIWRRDHMPEHYTVDWRLEPVVRLYIKANRETRIKSLGSPAETA